MDLRLDGKVALVTGGSKGIGKAIAAAMVEAGAKVMISSRKEENLKPAADEIGSRVVRRQRGRRGAARGVHRGDRRAPRRHRHPRQQRGDQSPHGADHRRSTTAGPTRRRR